MTDYYKILGINKNATAEEIKKAYRGLAMKHHPDRGGDEKKFKEIEEAYRILSDPAQKANYDNPNPFGNGNMNEEVFEQFFRNPFGFGNGFRSSPKNPSIHVTIDITLEDAFRGKTIDAEIGLSNGKTKLVSISIPPGIETGMQVKYNGMGETIHPKLQPGDLIATIRVLNHKIWQRQGDHLIYEKSISAWDAMLGSTLTITTIDGKMLSINIPAGTQPETTLSCKGEGMPNVRSGQRGNLLIKIKVEIPKKISKEQAKLIEDIRKHGI